MSYGDHRESNNLHTYMICTLTARFDPRTTPLPTYFTMPATSLCSDSVGTWDEIVTRSRDGPIVDGRSAY
eukprot:54081-Pleurochrysis_carterae.AAC.1